MAQEIGPDLELTSVKINGVQKEPESGHFIISFEVTITNVGDVRPASPANQSDLITLQTWLKDPSGERTRIAASGWGIPFDNLDLGAGDSWSSGFSANTNQAPNATTALVDYPNLLVELDFPSPDS